MTWGRAGDRARVGAATYPEESLLEERAALGGGGVLVEGRPDLHLVLGAELARGGDHRVAELALDVGPAERNMVATRDDALERATTRGAAPVARRFAEAMVADILI